MTDTLAPFELRPTCPKCCGERWTVKYHRYEMPEWIAAVKPRRDDPAVELVEAPRLGVTCERCGYSFFMRTHDAP